MLYQKGNKEDLLNEIAKKSNYQYISDLKYSKDDIRVKNAILKIPAYKYKVEEWNNAIRYLIPGDSANIQTFRLAEDARMYLLGIDNRKKAAE